MFPTQNPNFRKYAFTLLSYVGCPKSTNNITLPELRAIRTILTETCGLNNEVAKCIQEVAFAIDVNDIQLSELVSSLRDSTTKVERNDLFIGLNQTHHR